MNFDFSENKALINGLEKARKQLQSTRVEIGLPASASARNKYLLALHEHGAPAAHIPPRPVVSPALHQPSTQAAITDGLRSACEAAASGDTDGVASGFDSAGRAGVAGIRSYIDAGISPGNAPITISGGWMRNPTSGKPVHIPGKGFDKPLYDTGELYNAFDYEVKP